MKSAEAVTHEERAAAHARRMEQMAWEMEAMQTEQKLQQLLANLRDSILESVLPRSEIFSTRSASATIGSCAPVSRCMLTAWLGCGDSWLRLGTYAAVNTQDGPYAPLYLATGALFQ